MKELQEQVAMLIAKMDVALEFVDDVKKVESIPNRLVGCQKADLGLLELKVVLMRYKLELQGALPDDLKKP